MREIELNNGLKCLVDDDDFGYLNRFNWTAVKHRQTFYAIRNEYGAKDQKGHRIHRVIMGITNSKILIDHIDGNGLNNQKSNIRICTPPQNRHNSVGWGLSKYPGVTKRGNRWIARIRPTGNHFHLGSFATEQEAAEAYQKKAKELYGEFVRKTEIINNG